MRIILLTLCLFCLSRADIIDHLRKYHYQKTVEWHQRQSGQKSNWATLIGDIYLNDDRLHNRLFIGIENLNLTLHLPSKTISDSTNFGRPSNFFAYYDKSGSLKSLSDYKFDRLEVYLAYTFQFSRENLLDRNEASVKESIGQHKCDVHYRKRQEGDAFAVTKIVVFSECSNLKPNDTLIRNLRVTYKFKDANLGWDSLIQLKSRETFERDTKDNFIIFDQKFDFVEHLEESREVGKREFLIAEECGSSEEWMMSLVDRYLIAMVKEGKMDMVKEHVGDIYDEIEGPRKINYFWGFIGRN